MLRCLAFGNLATTSMNVSPIPPAFRYPAYASIPSGRLSIGPSAILKGISYHLPLITRLDEEDDRYVGLLLRIAGPSFSRVSYRSSHGRHPATLNRYVLTKSCTSSPFKYSLPARPIGPRSRTVVYTHLVGVSAANSNVWKPCGRSF